MHEGSEESTTQQTFVASEKRTAESYLCFAASLAVKRQPDTLFTDEYEST